ncbi:MAG TPA: DUF3027 domain-containing protein [Actinophytocola sp.]|jgi:hypothetical protein|nr:DUF3027 domain-containing protein [Actinophytocola sp.]
MSATESELRDPALLGEVDIARAAAQEEAADEEVGAHVDTHVEADTAVTHLFEAAKPGYYGWRWAVTVASAGPDTDVTISEVVLLPGPDALVAPDWVPWENRVQAGDLGVGDLLPTAPDDPRLVPAYVESDDPAVEALAREVGLGRLRVMARPARLEAAARWQHSEFGPRSDMARSAPAQCGTCGFYLPLAGSLRAAFGTCGNEISPADGHVVHTEYGCGAHSEAEVEQVSPVLVANLIYDDALLDVEPVPAPETEPAEATALPADAPAEPAAEAPAEAATAPVEAAEVPAEATTAPTQAAESPTEAPTTPAEAAIEEAAAEAAAEAATAGASAEAAAPDAPAGAATTDADAAAEAAIEAALPETTSEAATAERAGLQETAAERAAGEEPPAATATTEAPPAEESVAETGAAAGASPAEATTGEAAITDETPTSAAELSEAQPTHTQPAEATGELTESPAAETEAQPAQQDQAEPEQSIAPPRELSVSETSAVRQPEASEPVASLEAVVTAETVIDSPGAAGAPETLTPWIRPEGAARAGEPPTETATETATEPAAQLEPGPAAGRIDTPTGPEATNRGGLLTGGLLSGGLLDSKAPAQPEAAPAHQPSDDTDTDADNEDQAHGEPATAHHPWEPSFRPYWMRSAERRTEGD